MGHELVRLDPGILEEGSTRDELIFDHTGGDIVLKDNVSWPSPAVVVLEIEEVDQVAGVDCEGLKGDSRVA